jgi:hypothetical protein
MPQTWALRLSRSSEILHMPQEFCQLFLIVSPNAPMWHHHIIDLNFFTHMTWIGVNMWHRLVH